MIDLVIHTNDQHIKIACLRYWNLNKNDEFTEDVTTLAAEYGKNIPGLLKFVNKHSSAYHKEIVCNECGERYVYTSRTDYKAPHFPMKGRYTCKDCKQRVQTENYSYEQSRLEVIRHRPYTEFLQKHFSEVEGLLVTPDQMSLKQAIYLFSLVQHSGGENYRVVSPLDVRDQPFSPTTEYTEQILFHLVGSEFITLHPATDTAAIYIEEDQLARIEFEKVSWQLTIGNNTYQRKKIIGALESKLHADDWRESWQEELRPLCREIIIQEYLQYIYYKFESSYYEAVNPYFGDKTKQVLALGLEKFSVAQMFRFILNAFNQTKVQMKTFPFHAQRIASIFNDELRSEIEEAIKSGTNIKPKQRSPKYPESTISKVLFKSVLKKEGGSFDTVFRMDD